MIGRFLSGLATAVAAVVVAGIGLSVAAYVVLLAMDW